MERPHYHGHRKRLRERFLKGGFAGFAEHEVIELLLTLAIPRADVKPPAKALLGRFGSLRGVLDAPLPELRSVADVGEVAATALHLIRESATLYLQEAKEDALMVLPYRPERVDEAGRHFDATVGRIRAGEFAVTTPPEAAICREYDLRTLCRAEGVIGETGDSEALAA